MTGDRLIQEMAVIVEECSTGTRDRVTGDMQPLSRAEWIAIRERFQTLAAMNMPRESDEHPQAT